MLKKLDFRPIQAILWKLEHRITDRQKSKKIDVRKCISLSRFLMYRHV